MGSEACATAWVGFASEHPDRTSACQQVSQVAIAYHVVKGDKVFPRHIHAVHHVIVPVLCRQTTEHRNYGFIDVVEMPVPQFGLANLNAILEDTSS